MGILNSTILDVVIGLVFVYLLLAIICTTMNEWVANGFSMRSNNLASAIKQLLDQQPGSKDATGTFLEQFYAHPLISGMMAPGNNHFSYLPSRTFATAVMDLATTQKPGMITFDDLQNGIEALPPGDVRKALLALIQNADNDLKKAQKNIEDWFDDTMDRASGWFKNRSQWVTILVAVLLTVTTNADTVRITSTLWKSPTLRSVMVVKATNRAETPQSAVEYKDKNDPLNPTIKASKDELDALQQVLGWTKADLQVDWLGWLKRLVGWILTIAAISMGAPFWFDLLSKLVNIRNAGKKPQTSDAAANTDAKAKVAA